MAPRPFQRPAGRIGFRFGVDDGKSRFRRRQSPLQLRIDIRQTFHHRLQQTRRGEKGHEFPRGQAARQRQAPGDVHHAGEGDDHDQLHQRTVRGPGLSQLHLEPADRLDTVPETASLVVLSAEYLHHLLTRDALLQHLGQLAHALLQPGGIAPQALGNALDRIRGRRQGGQGDQGERPVQIEQIQDQPDESAAVLDQGDQDIGGGARDLIHVIRDL